MRQDRSGFTLIELLVVIAIIGILAGLVLVALGDARKKAQDVRVKSDLRQMLVLSEIFYDSNDFAFTNINGGKHIDVCTAAPSANTCAGGIEGSVQTLVSDLQSTGTAIWTDTSGDGPSSYCVKAQLISDPTQSYCFASGGVVMQGSTWCAGGYCTCLGGC